MNKAMMEAIAAIVDMNVVMIHFQSVGLRKRGLLSRYNFP